MKYLILITGILIFSYNGIAQSGILTECVNCKYNEISQISLSSAIGTYNVASGQTSFASGTECSALGDYSTAMGKNTMASGNSSFAATINSVASGNYSTAFGYGAEASGERSAAIGLNAAATEVSTLALGEWVKASGSYSMVIGTGPAGNYFENDEANSLMIGFGSNKPTFVVGSSNGTNTSGRVGIGNISTPEAKLHIKADTYENATLFLQSSDWNNKYAEIQLGTTGNTIKAEKDVGLTFKTEDYYLFEDGNVGIGTSAPETLLHVHINSQDNNIQAARFSNEENRRIFIVPKLSSNGYSSLSREGDFGIFWSDDGGGSNDNSGLVIAPHVNSYTGLRIDNYGNVGIGTNSPTHLLEVDGDMQVSSDSYLLGNVGIGTSNLNANYILNVNGKILAEELKIQEVVGADFVFADDYKLPKLEDVEKYIEENKHLPEIPSAEEMKTNGVEVGDLQIKLLQKVEELTLYIIEQQKEIEELKEKVGR